MATLNVDYAKKFLAMQPEWRAIKQQYDAIGEWLRPYAFRERYRLLCHRLGVEVGDVAVAMGNSLALHSSGCMWAFHATTAAAF